MASPETKPNVCLMCLDAPAVKKLGTCEHSYCMPCLQAHMEEQMKSEHKVISACPACQQSKLENPKGGANVDNAGEGKVTVPSISQTPTTSEKKTTPFVHGNCKLCHYKGITVEAVNICKECTSILLCGKCSEAHGKNKLTKNHVVTALAGQTREEVLCNAHDEALKFFCYTCSTNVCHVCISLDHEDHVVETFNDVVHDEVRNIQSALENEKEWSNTLQSDEKELQQSKATAQEMEDVLIKAIEDHAEKCIEEILKSKEALKKQVRGEFEVIRVMEKQLEAMPELQRASADIAAAANRLLNEQAELHSTYVERLVGLKQQLDKLKEGHPAYEEDRERYQKAFKDVCQRAMKFYPRTPNCKIGGFQDLYAGPRCNAGGPCACETCERKADPARVVECRQNGLCTCGTCAKVSKWPNENRTRECCQKGSCTCGVCTKVSKWPNEKRVDECRQTGTCKCGTCGCVYSRKTLRYHGYCIQCFGNKNNKITLGEQMFP